MVELFKAFLFGIIEGITEWLPISSTGHMILLNEFIKLDVSDEFYSMFQVVIQLGAIMAVVVLFWKQIFPFGKPRGRRARHSVRGIQRYVKPEIFMLWFKILVACIPAAVVGILFDELFEALFYNYLTVAIMLILFGIAFIVIENINRGARGEDPFAIGYFVSDGVSDRDFPAHRRDFSRHLPVRRDDCGGIAPGSFADCGGGVYVFPGDSGHVRREPSEDREIRAFLQPDGADDSSDRHGDGICIVSDCHPVSAGLYSEA